MILDSRFFLTLALLGAGSAPAVVAQEPASTTESGAATEPQDKPETKTPSAPAPGTPDEMGIVWQLGPTLGRLGSVSEVDVPAGFRFTDARGTRRLLEVMQNPTSGRETGTIMPIPSEAEEMWFVFFQYDSDGHVKDDDRDEIDADDLMSSFKEGQEYGNEERRKRGWEELELVGWYKEPFYDPKTNNLTWATIVKGKNSPGESVNWSTRLLGRTGCMNVDLVLGRDIVEKILPDFDALMGGFRYVEGQRYSEFQAGDKIAEYGLTALVAGGAGLVAAKTGLLAKFWKVLVFGAVAIGAFFKKIFGFGKKDGTPSEGSTS